MLLWSNKKETEDMNGFCWCKDCLSAILMCWSWSWVWIISEDTFWSQCLNIASVTKILSRTRKTYSKQPVSSNGHSLCKIRTCPAFESLHGTTICMVRMTSEIWKHNMCTTIKLKCWLLCHDTVRNKQLPLSYNLTDGCILLMRLNELQMYAFGICSYVYWNNLNYSIYIWVGL